MTREEFIKTAEDCGYNEAEVQDLLKVHDEMYMPYNMIPLVLHNVD